MSGFASDWLSLRESYDHAARAELLLQALAAWAEDRRQLAIIDLGSGTGSNLRAISEHLKVPQAWTLIEHDPLLIETGTAQLAMLPKGVDATYRQVDLAGDLDKAIPARTDLITAAAFLDLVSAAWLDRLMAVAEARRAALYIALTYDGGMRWRPGDIFDATIKKAFHAHQATDKGFGPALGPTAVSALRDRLQPLGGRLLVEPSDWQLRYEDIELQKVLLDGYMKTALETAPDQAAEIRSWALQRRKQIDAGRSTLRVGHEDILWLPDG
jgi:hypothetical protein